MERELHPRTPAPRGMGFMIVGKVDADHAGDTVTRRSRTGFIVHLNSAPICWSKEAHVCQEGINAHLWFILNYVCVSDGDVIMQKAQ